MAPRDDDQQVKGGPANHAAHTDLDAPTPPGGPLRQDQPGADVNPTGPVNPEVPGPDPDVQPSSTPDGPSTIPSPTTPEGEPGPDPDPDQEHAVQAENAETSLDQPSDGSGGE
jgi:hypothetical protein